MRKIGSRVVNWLVVTVVTAMLSPVSMSFGAVLNDEVTSVKLKEADGTSGQSTNSGSGVKTGHIQDGAVTASKLGVVCPTGNYLQYVVGSGWVCSVGTAGPVGPQGPVGLTGLQGVAGATGPTGVTGLNGNTVLNGAGNPVATSVAGVVGDFYIDTLNSLIYGPKAGADWVGAIGMSLVGPAGLAGATGSQGLQGPIGLTGSKGLIGATGPEGPVGATGPQGPAGTNPHYSKIAVVAKSGGDYLDPVAAFNNTPAWCGAPSVDNPCLIKIMPGIYDLGGNSLDSRPFIDVEGSGENTTLIKSTDYVMYSRDNVEIRHLTVESTGGNSAVAFAVNGSSKLTHVTAKALGAVYGNCGILVSFGSPIMTDVTVEILGNLNNDANGISVSNQADIVTLNSVRVTATNGRYNYGILIDHGETVMNNVTVKAFEGPGGGNASYGMLAANGGTASIKNSNFFGNSVGISTTVPVSIQNSTIKGLGASLELSATAVSNIALSQLDGPVSIMNT